VRFIAIASPNAAPYGRAAVQALKSAGLWEKLERKVAYATNISMAREYAASGNAEAALTAYSLVINAGGRIIEIDAASHEPLDQALAVVSSSKNVELAREFAMFLTKRESVEILRRYGYDVRRQ
jgi:molybdate transport system substrate-binding protein